MEEKNLNTNMLGQPGFKGSFGHHKRSRRFGWMAVLFAITANVLIFLSINWVNRTPVAVPSEDYTVFELFKPEPVLQETMRQIDPTPVVPEEHILQTPVPMQMAKLDASTFKPRLIEWVPDSLHDLPGVSVYAAGDAGLRDLLPASQVDNPPRKISGGSPVYPRWARPTKAEGTVTLRFVVGIDGRVSGIEIQRIEGDERFAIAAKRAVSRWRFKPALDKGRPVAVWGIQKIQFQFRGRR
jgi:TonB family protein